MTLTLPEIVAMGDALQAHVGKNDYVLVALGARGPNLDMPDGNILATVRVGNDEATSEAKYLNDAITMARGKILRAREEKAKKAAKEKADKKADIDA